MKHLLNQKLLSRLTTTLLVCLLSWSANAGEGNGTHDFGKDITENQSCELAKLKATKNLIESEIGQVIEVRDLMSCVNDNCELNSFKWIVFPAIIKNSVFETRIITEDSIRLCRATVQGDVIPLDKFYKEDHDFSITMNKNGKYYENDYLQIDIWGQSKQYYQMFLVNDKVTRLYPNPYQSEDKLKDLQIPNSAYALRVTKEQNPNSMIVVVSSQQQFDMNSTYNLKDFTETLMFLKTKGYRLRTYDFSVQ